MARLAAILAGIVIVLGGIGGLILFLQARDDAGIEAEASGPGTLEPDNGNSHGADAEAGATSGPHRAEPIEADRRALTADQILHALELGNVVITYPGSRPPAAIVGLQRDLSGSFEAELAASGLAVVLAEGDELEALAWRHRLAPSGPADPELRAFAEYWLGKGAPDR